VQLNDVEDLSAAVQDASDLLEKIGDDSIAKQTEAILSVCEEAGRAWSGSNIGYHSTVYYRGLGPKPPSVEFSSEWGLMDVWPTHQPDRGWVTMDEKAVEAELLARAGSPNLADLVTKVTKMRDQFLSLKAAVTSILSASLSGENKDTYLQQRLDRAEKMKAPTVNRIASDFLPRGSIFTRDTLALGQGIKVAPHQMVAAHALAVRALEKQVADLREVARESANHMRRLLARDGKMSTKANASVFVGHGRSLLWRELKDFIKDRLGLPVDEFNRVSTAGVPTATRLKEMLDSAGFAFLIFTGEDEQPDGKLHARENVVHEAGLFQGRLGFNKAIILLEDGCEEFSNIHGLGQIRFPKGRISAIFEQVREVLEREGVVAK
jgi:predicted nucleotide-binding protein